MSFLLESVEGGAVRGRYSIIGLDPDLIWRTVRQCRNQSYRANNADDSARVPNHRCRRFAH